MPIVPGGKQVVESVFNSFKEGRINKSDYETFNSTYDPVKDNRQEAMDALRTNATRQKANAARSALKFDELSLHMDDQESGSTFMSNLISPAFRANSSEVNIDMRKNSIQNLLSSNLGNLSESLSTRLTRMLNPFTGEGYDKSAQDMFIDAVLDPNADVPAQFKTMAKEWNTSNKQALKMHTDAGGDIKSLGDNYLPQTHDTMKMMKFEGNKSKAKTKDDRLIQDAKAAKDQWIVLTKKGLDYEKMNLANASAKEIEEILGEVYETITSGGLNKVRAAIKKKISNLEVYEKMLKDGRLDAAAKYKEQYKIKDGETAADYYSDFKIEPMTANKKQAHRELHFTPQGWKSYQNTYGQKDVYKSIEDYLDAMSMDIAAMQVLGPNPTSVWKKLKDKAGKEGKTTGSQGHLQGMFDVATGITDASAAESNFEKIIEQGAGGFRSLGVASDLGGAAISSLTDPILSSATAKHVGMNRFTTMLSQLGTVGKRIAAGMKVSEKELFAKRLGITMNSFVSSIRNNRFSEGGGSERLQKVADMVLRSSGLTAWTNALKTTFELELSGYMADNIGKPLSSFTFGKQLEEVYGITQSQWDKVTSKYKTSFKEGGYFDPSKLYMDEPELALRLMDIINQESHYAVIMPDSRVRSITTGGGAAKGSGIGETVRTALMYKSFPISMITTHLGRALGIGGTKGANYGASIVVGLMAGGTAIYQLKEVMRGKDPIKPDKWDDPLLRKLLLKGFLQGGGAGVAGDLIFSDATRYGGGMVSTVVGKLGQPLEDIDTLKKLFQKDKDTKLSDVAAAAVKMGSNYVPGRNLWYTRILYERAIRDQAMKLVDPDYNKKLRMNMKKMKKETGQGYWSKPGQMPFTN